MQLFVSIIQVSIAGHCAGVEQARARIRVGIVTIC